MTHLKESNKFWKSIIYKDGKLDEEQVLKELSDFYFVMQEVPKVYTEITGGLLSKLMYPAQTVIAEFNEKFYDKDITGDDIEAMIKDCKNLKELKQELKDYFNL